MQGASKTASQAASKEGIQSSINHDRVTLCGGILEPPPAACDTMQVYDTAHLLFQAYVIKFVVKIQVRALPPCCDKTTKVDDMAHQLLRLVLRYHCYRCMP